MRFSHVVLIISLFAAIIFVRMNKTPQNASNFIVVGSNKRIQQLDSIDRIDYDVQFLFIRVNGDTIRIDSLKYIRKLRTFKIK